MIAAVPLLLVLLAALWAQSRPVAVAAGVLLLFQLTGFDELSRLLGRFGPAAGWALLVAAVLAPFATGSALPALAPLLTPLGLAALAAGFLATFLANRGLLFFRLHPELLLALTLGFLIALLWQSPGWPALGKLGSALPAGGLNETRVASGMAFLRLVSGLIEIGAAYLIFRLGRVGPALQVNATLSLIGPAVSLLVCTLGLVCVAVKFSLWRTGLVALGVVLIFLGTR